jgi:hypothetical protein
VRVFQAGTHSSSSWARATRTHRTAGTLNAQPQNTHHHPPAPGLLVVRQPLRRWLCPVLLLLMLLPLLMLVLPLLLMLLLRGRRCADCSAAPAVSAGAAFATWRCFSRHPPASDWQCLGVGDRAWLLVGGFAEAQQTPRAAACHTRCLTRCPALP